MYAGINCAVIPLIYHPYTTSKGLKGQGFRLLSDVSYDWCSKHWVR